MKLPRHIKEKLDQLEKKVEQIGQEDGLLGAPDLYRLVIAREIEAVADEWLPDPDDEGIFTRRMKVAQDQLGQATKTDQDLENAQPARPVKAWLTLIAVMLGSVAVAAAALSLAPGRARTVTLGLGGASIALLAFALTLGPLFGRWLQRRRADHGRRSAEAAILVIQREEVTRADEGRARTRWIETQKAKFDHLYLFYRKARGEMAAVDNDEGSHSGSGSAAA